MSAECRKVVGAAVALSVLDCYGLRHVPSRLDQFQWLARCQLLHDQSHSTCASCSFSGTPYIEADGQECYFPVHLLALSRQPEPGHDGDGANETGREGRRGARALTPSRARHG
jgi:hypothetical protein